MAIEVSKLIRKIRLKAMDFDEIKYSDYQIINAINDVIEYLNASYALRNSDFLEKAKEYHLTSEQMQKGVTLPYDFMTLVGLNDLQCGRPLAVVPSTETPKFDEYKIVGSKIYSGVPDFTITYRKKIEEIETEKDEIDLPAVFEQLIRNFAFSVLTDGEDGMLQAIEQAVEAIVPARRYTHARIKMPFMV